MNGSGSEAQEFRQKFRPQKKFYKHTCLVSHKTKKQCQAFDKHGLKAYSHCPCGHRVAQDCHCIGSLHSTLKDRKVNRILVCSEKCYTRGYVLNEMALSGRRDWLVDFPGVRKTSQTYDIEIQSLKYNVEASQSEKRGGAFSRQRLQQGGKGA